MRNSNRLPFFLLVYFVLCVLLYPLYRQVFDFDAIGYFSVTKHLAAGEWFEAVNGYWSPLHCWLALPLYKAGLNEFDAFKIISIVTGAGILITLSRLLKRIQVTEPAVMAIAIPMVLCYVFCFQAADILLCLLLLIYAHLVTNPQTKKNSVYAGLIACLAFFAKAYAFPFFLLHFTVTHWRNSKNLRWGIGAFLLLALPWLAALYWKYRFITFGYSGQLNIRWAFYGQGIDTRSLYAISPFPLKIHWEDPYSYPWNFSKEPPYSLLKHLSIFFKNLGYLLLFILFFSFLSPLIALKKRNPITQHLFLLAILFPIGYLFVALEIRYLFLLSFLFLVIGATQRLPKALFYASFLIFPITTLIQSVRKDASLFQLAQQTPTGKWITNSVEAYPAVARVAYLTNATLYQFPRPPKSIQEMLPACRQAGINYYFHYVHSATEAASFRQTELFKSAFAEIPTSQPNLILIKLQ